MSNQRGTYSRRNWTNRWINRIKNAAKDKRAKLAERYNVGNWKMYIKDEPEQKPAIIVSPPDKIEVQQPIPKKKSSLFTKFKKVFK